MNWPANDLTGAAARPDVPIQSARPGRGPGVQAATAPSKLRRVRPACPRDGGPHVPLIVRSHAPAVVSPADRVPVLPNAPDRGDRGCPRPELLVGGEDQPAPLAVQTVAGRRLADHVQEDHGDGARVLASIYQSAKASDNLVRSAERREFFERRHGRQRAMGERRNEFGR